MIKIYITDLAAYNEGTLIGEWVELPMDEDELREKVQSILKEGYKYSQEKDLCACHEHEEWFVTDYMGPGQDNLYSEYMDIYDLNEKLLLVEEIDEYNIFHILINYFDLEETIDRLEQQDFIYRYDTSEEEIAHEFIENTIGDLPPIVESNLDYEGIYHELEINNSFIWDNNYNCVEVFH